MNNVQISFIEIPRKLWEKEPSSRPLQELAKDAMGIERRIQKQVNVGTERARYALLCNWIEEQAVILSTHPGAVREHCWGPSLVGSNRAEMYLALVEILQNLEPTMVEKIIVRSLHGNTLESLRAFLESLRIDGLRLLRTFGKGVEGESAKATLLLKYEALCRALGLKPSKRQAHPLRIGKSFYAPGPEVEGQRMLFEAMADDDLRSALSLPEGQFTSAVRDAAREKAAIYCLAARSGAAVVEVLSMVNVHDVGSGVSARGRPSPEA